MYPVQCAMCLTRTTLYMMPAKYTCPKDWTTEYYGYLMTERNHPAHYRSQFTCVDKLLKPIIGTSHNHNGLLFHLVEGRCGHGSLQCPPHEETKELTCAVCRDEPILLFFSPIFLSSNSFIFNLFF